MKDYINIKKMETLELNNLKTQIELLKTIISEENAINLAIEDEARIIFKIVDESLITDGIVELKLEDYKKIHLFLNYLRNTYHWNKISNDINDTQKKIKFCSNILSILK